MRAAPRVVDVHLVESEAPPGGIGEPGVPPSAAALCNAIYAATKTRIRTALQTLRRSLELLQTDHVDLWLIHWPGEGAVNLDLWRAQSTFGA